MGFFNRRNDRDTLAGKIVDGQTIQDLNEQCVPMAQLAYQRLAIELCVDLIAKTMARVNWRYYSKFKHTSHQLESLLNLRPNAIESSYEFFTRWVNQMVYEQEALVVTKNNQIYVASGFTREQPTFDTQVFGNVQVFDQDATGVSTKAKNVMYTSLGDAQIMNLLKQYQKQYGELVQSAINGYQSNKTKRYIMTNPNYRTQINEVQEKFNAMLEQNLRSFADTTGKSALYAKPADVTLEDFSDKQIMAATDSRSLMTDVFERTANAFHIPLEYVLGGKPTQIEIDNFLIDGVFPFIDLFEQAFNAMQFSELQYRNGTYLKADRHVLRMADINTIGNFVKNVLPTGVLTLGDFAERYLGADKLPEDVADLRVITKNYSKVDDFIKGSSEPVAQEVNEVIETDEQTEESESDLNE